MRKELEYRKADSGKIDQAKDLIEQIASGEKDEETVNAALTELGRITGRQHSQTEFAEYWGWTDLDSIAEQAFVDPPCVNDLTREELIEMIAIIKKAMIHCEDSRMMYYEELLHRSLPLTDVFACIDLEEDDARIADKMLTASKSNVILL